MHLFNSDLKARSVAGSLYGNYLWRIRGINAQEACVWPSVRVLSSLPSAMNSKSRGGPLLPSLLLCETWDSSQAGVLLPFRNKFIYFWLCWVFTVGQGFLWLRRREAALQLWYTGVSRGGFSPWSAGSREGGLQELWPTGSGPRGRWDPLDQGSDLCLLHWQADS